MSNKCQMLFMQLAEFENCDVYGFLCLQIFEFLRFWKAVLQKWFTNELQTV